MKTTYHSKVSKNSLMPAIAGASIVLAALAFFVPAKRQYSAGVNFKETEKKEKDKDALGMAKFFFNARKDNHTNSLNYQAMFAAAAADRQMSVMHKSARSVASNPFKTFTWNSMGPTNIGGRTRAILIDNNDPSHQTIFAGGVTGGIWKSTNGGSTWGNSSPMISYSQNDTMANINVCDIAQGSDGAIYIGTGEGFDIDGGESSFSSGEVGNGIFKSTDDGVTWTNLKGTIPSPADVNTDNWAYTNRIGCQPNNAKVIYAAHNGGVEMSTNGGTTWRFVKKSTGGNLTGNALDLKISQDGSVIMTSLSSLGAYYCYPSSADNYQDSIFYPVNYKGAGALPHGWEIELAISPTDPNRIYAAEISNDIGGLGTFDSKSGIFMTETAKTNGGYWYDIGPGGTIEFDPYHSAYDQCNYDNTIAVDPSNEGRLLLGGFALYQWRQVNSSDTVGYWTADGYSNYVHPDHHAIVFDLNNPLIAYNGNDGGVYKSFDGGNTWSAFNRNYNVTQYYGIAYTSEVNDSNFEGVGGGTQDNGSPYISGNSYYYSDALDITGGDGGQSAFSQLVPSVAFGGTDDGTLVKVNLTSYTGGLFYTSSYGANVGADIDSIYSLPNEGSGVCFVLPMVLYENPYDLNNVDSMKWFSDTACNAGSTVYPISANGSIPFPYVLPHYVGANDTINVPNRVVAKLATAFSASQGVWITAQALDITDQVVWKPIGGPFSKPDACTGGPIHSMAWSGDGDGLWCGTEDEGYLYRFTNLNALIGNKFSSGALWYKGTGSATQVATGDTTVVCTKMSLPSSVTNRDMLSIAVDPQNSSSVMFTMGGYGNTDFVYYSNNALASSPTFTSKQGNLPPMPVYGCILDIKNGNGKETWATKAAMVATEHGIYTTNDITVANPVWVKNNNGMVNGMVLAIKQQTMEPWNCNNSGVIYIGTHGRGIWSTDSTYVPTAIKPVVSSTTSYNGLVIYPNPMSTQGNVEFTLNSAENLNMTIYDIQGKAVFTQQIGTQTVGKHIVPFSANMLKSGTYFISLTGENYKQVGKFIVQN